MTRSLTEVRHPCTPSGETPPSCHDGPRERRTTHPKGTAPFSKVPKWLLGGTVSPTAYQLAGALAGHADARTGLAKPARRTLADEIGCRSLRTVDRALAELEEVGYISRSARYYDHERTGKRCQTSSWYQLHPDRIVPLHVVDDSSPGAADDAPPVQRVAPGGEQRVAHQGQEPAGQEPEGPSTPPPPSQRERASSSEQRGGEQVALSYSGQTREVLAALADYLGAGERYDWGGNALLADLRDQRDAAGKLARAIDARLDGGWTEQELVDRLTETLPDSFVGG